MWWDLGWGGWVCLPLYIRHALKCLRPRESALREIELQYMCGAHPNVVNVNDCYDNTFQRPGESGPCEIFHV